MAKSTPEEAAEAAAVAKAAEAAEFAALAAAETAELEAEEKAKAGKAEDEATAFEPADHPKALEADEDGNVEVETNGDFMLVDPISGAEIEATGATLVKLTSFIQQRYELGQLKAA